MNRNPDVKLPWLLLLALGCFACSTFMGAQQTSGMAPAGLAPAAGALPSGLNSVDSSGPDRNSMRRFASSMGPEVSNPAGPVSSRSTWMAGSNSMGPAGAVMWNAPQVNFSGATASSWNAGAGSFGLDRQQGGIWLGSPAASVQPNSSVESSELFSPRELTSRVQSSDLFNPSEPASAIESGDSFTSPTLTPKGAALIKGAALSAPYALSGFSASHLETGVGIRSVANPLSAQRGVGRVKSQSGPRTGRLGTLGNGSGLPPATLATPSSGTLNSPADGDTLHLNDGIGSEQPLGSDEIDDPHGTSH